jgi:hypothetical protein
MNIQQEFRFQHINAKRGKEARCFNYDLPPF